MVGGKSITDYCECVNTQKDCSFHKRGVMHDSGTVKVLSKNLHLSSTFVENKGVSHLIKTAFQKQWGINCGHVTNGTQGRQTEHMPQQ